MGEGTPRPINNGGLLQRETIQAPDLLPKRLDTIAAAIEAHKVPDT